ncbi:alkaline phosphatase D family protein [Desmospora profundinema]|uniref:Alkaline phosphatase D n=1 Tax=Desmospora profundinema TaxID=1571184 RepID=A0ABU1IIW0_9BACL|nr:alkaline phosphatase D family protein [Desmospora profundinema]MDR6224697.1 alkaline phosphatase D [Desmospora profundinema]
MKTPHKNDPERRLFLKTFLAGSALFILETWGIDRMARTWANTGSAPSDFPRFQPRHPAGEGFPQSVASGDPTPSGALLWSRVDPDLTDGLSAPLDTSLIRWLEQSPNNDWDAFRNEIEKGGWVMVEIAKSSTFGDVNLTGFTPVWNDFDHVVKVDVDGLLQPQTLYYYRFITHTGHVSQTGRFKTMPPAGASVSSIRFSYVSCQDYTNGYYTALRYAAEEEVDLVIHLGDYIYESVGDPTYQNPLPDRAITLPSGKTKAHSLADYRYLYQRYRSDPDLQKLHERHAMVSIWDDHEYANDTYYPAVAPDENPEPDPERRLLANQAWFEYTPARVSFDKHKSFEDSIQIYRSLSIGDLAHVILTDERLYRSPHPCGTGTWNRYFSRGCDQMNASDQTMLGNKGQKEWFLNEVTSSSAVWKIWGNEVQFTPLKLLNRYLNLDAWDGYAGERRALTRSIKEAGVKNFIAITGDLHSFEANLILEEYNRDTSHAVGVEFMVGSVTSSNLKEMVTQVTRFRGMSHSTGSPSSPIPPQSMKEIVDQLSTDSVSPQSIIGWILDKLNLLIYNENPWIRLFNSSTHGYCVMELTPQKATWTAYSVDDIRSNNGDKTLLFQCEVPRDDAHIRILKK